MSTMSDRRSRKRLATRQGISDAATRLFIERGFDQGHRLAQHLGSRTGHPVLLALRRRDADAQRGRSRAERLQARGHFICIAPELVTGMRIVLVDDVVTTGSTLLDCAASLQECGAFVREAVVLAYA